MRYVASALPAHHAPAAADAAAEAAPSLCTLQGACTHTHLAAAAVAAAAAAAAACISDSCRAAVRLPTMPLQAEGCRGGCRGSHWRVSQQLGSPAVAGQQLHVVVAVALSEDVMLAACRARPPCLTLLIRRLLHPMCAAGGFDRPMHDAGGGGDGGLDNPEFCKFTLSGALCAAGGCGGGSLEQASWQLRSLAAGALP